MLNEDLLTPQEKEIANLKLAIQAFKKYDKERKEYYKEAMVELGQLRSYVQELEEDNDYAKKIRGYKKQLASYQSMYEHQKTVIAALSDKENLAQDLIQLQFYKENYLKQKEANSALTKKNTELKKEINTYLDQISKLVYELHRGDVETVKGE